MAEKAGITRSLNTVRTELEYLRDAGVLAPPQFQSIMAQLPGAGGAPSQYVDPRFSQPQGPPQGPPPGYVYPAQQIAQQAQDPNNPAHPEHPHHMQWAKTLGSKFGNAAIWGGGATLGADAINSVWNNI